ncbi:hypothetical protein Q9K01_08420 [Qipengyuania sp. DY56-A-20]|jgi:hypothetical protein|uniref:Uncharacterized protein n=1 Tax=Qipengyuania benthica TaxID=3067651 RepID=A0ABT9H8J5_9SPHN|nr:hypothetical protein [Qipengyuania sp. DY56-A-20]MDP4539643.1 hypothetical protein [Qipengyuania sp. DY56-A-20]
MNPRVILKRGTEAFFVTVGLLGTLHYLLGWPEQFTTIWIVAIGTSIGMMIGEAFRRRALQGNK